MASPSASSSVSPDRSIQASRDHKVRKKTYRDRKKSIFKKAEELSILCDVDVAVILYNKEAAAAETWPRDPTQINRILKKYKAKTQLLASTSHNASSPSPSIPKKRKDTNLDLSVTLGEDGGMNSKKLKLKTAAADDDEDKNSQEACREKPVHYYEFPILWQRSDEVDILHEDVSRIVDGDDDDDDYEVKLASLEVKQQAIMKRIALLEASSLCL